MITRFKALCLSFCLATLFLLGIDATSAQTKAQTKRATSAMPPNVLVLVADDLGWNDVGYHMSTAPTPTINRLAKQGLVLNRFYAYPVCSPTRAALITGKMPRRLGIVDVVGGGQSLPGGLPTLPATLRSAGYQTSLIGKWHLGPGSPPMRNGFDHFYGFMGAEIDYFKHTRIHGFGVDWQRDGQTVEEEGYSTFLLRDEAIRQLKERDPKRPFYMQVTFNAVHVPVSAPEEYKARYKGLGEAEATYQAVIETLDMSMGSILKTLDEQGLRDNTLVVFFSDNGALRDNTPLRAGKGTVYEGGIRTPALVRWPGKIPAGRVSELPVAVQDLFPTIVTATGHELPKEYKLDGMDLWASLKDGRKTDRKPFLIATYNIAMYDGEWKLIEGANGDHALYNIIKDISETDDQYTKQPELAARLLKSLTELKKDLPDAPVRRGPGGPGGGAGPPGRPGNRRQGGPPRRP